MVNKILYCPFCKLTKVGRAKAFYYYEYLVHITEEHGSDYVKVSGEVVTADDLKKRIHTLGELSVIKK